MTEVYVYHLQRQSLEAVLPTLLTRSRERGWRALVRLAGPERVSALDDHLWAFSDESFLAHGTAAEPDPAEQPILLTTGDDNLNGADILFVADGGAPPQDIATFQRVAILLDGRDDQAVAVARQTWKTVKAAGHEVAYWQEDGSGRWSRRA